MSWELDPSDTDNLTIRLKMENGWRAGHNMFNNVGGSSNLAVKGNIKLYEYGSSGNLLIKNFSWGDGTTSNIYIKVLSRDNDSAIDTITTQSGDNASFTTEGLTHTYADNATTEYVISWDSCCRVTTDVQNSSANGTSWRNQTKVNIRGTYSGNSSPVSAVPAIVRIQDNTSFAYQVSASDPDGDTLSYRWGTKAEFFSSSGSFTQPTGMTLSPSGLIQWDIRNSGGQATVEDDYWVAVIMVSDNDSSGNEKSYIPVDFFFKVTDPSNAAPAFTEFPPNSTVSLGSTKIFTIKSTDDSGIAPSISVLNPPSDNVSIWTDNSSNSMEAGDNTTTFFDTF